MKRSAIFWLLHRNIKKAEVLVMERISAFFCVSPEKIRKKEKGTAEAAPLSIILG